MTRPDLDIDNSAVLWLKKTARKHYWRVSKWYGLDDLVQDGFVFWYRAVNRYQDVDNRAHIMALFKRTYLNYIHDLSKGRVYDVLHQSLYHKVDEVRACELTDLTHDDNWLWETIGAAEGDEEMNDLILDAPPEVQAVLRLYCSDEGQKRLRCAYRRKLGGARETFNARLCRLTGLAPDLDLVGLVRSYLKPA